MRVLNSFACVEWLTSPRVVRARVKHSALLVLISWFVSSAQLLSPLIAAIEEVDQNEWDSIIDVSWRKEWVNLLREVSRHGQSAPASSPYLSSCRHQGLM